MNVFVAVCQINMGLSVCDICSLSVIVISAVFSALAVVLAAAVLWVFCKKRAGKFSSFLHYDKTFAPHCVHLVL